jgi:hypothetical protein
LFKSYAVQIGWELWGLVLISLEFWINGFFQCDGTEEDRYFGKPEGFLFGDISRQIKKYYSASPESLR